MEFLDARSGMFKNINFILIKKNLKKFELIIFLKLQI
jgi:hypothetical protein